MNILNQQFNVVFIFLHKVGIPVVMLYFFFFFNISNSMGCFYLYKLYKTMILTLIIKLLTKCYKQFDGVCIS